MPAYDIIFFSILSSLQMILHDSIKLSDDSLSVFLTTKNLLENNSALRTFHSLPGSSWGNMYFGYICWKPRQCFIISSISEFMLIQYMDSHASNLVSSMPMIVNFSCFTVCCCNSAGMIAFLPFITTTSIMASSSLKMASKGRCLVVNHFCSIASHFSC